ncbi:MAG TPA: translation initiation factor IF-2 [Bacillota bacterium]|jgi:translation initiation factor IF-2|nr:translation initiation factor IF-2 [Fastidiosipila sp.]HPX92929.1 translation initiation factor IF-2 [Bacillota bacterium]HQB80681.1 translation initiation factor IF-2 [Bacillota bacterium]
MAKREEADSGLMSGFITEEELLRRKKEHDSMEAVPEPEPLPVPPVPDKEAEQAAPPPGQDLKDLPVPSTIDMQGISGKVIPGVIKIVKKPKPAPVSEPEAVVAAPEVPAPEAEVQTAEVKAEPEKKPAARKKAEKPEVDKPEVEKPKAVKAEIKKPEAAAEKSGKAKPEKKERVKARPLSVAEKSLPITERVTEPAVAAPARPAATRPRPLITEDGKPLRAQRGSYVGADRDTPAVERQPRRAAPASEEARPVRPASAPPRGRGQAAAAPVPGPVIEAEVQKPGAASRRSQKGRDRRPADYRDRSRREQQEVISHGGRRRKPRTVESAPEQPKRPVAQLTQVTLPSTLTVKELAEAIKKTTADVIMKLMALGMMATINQEIDYDTAEIIASEFGIASQRLVEITEEDILFDDTVDKDEDLVSRPPVVVVMGHVDHGKTSILDYIRESSVTEGEAGGITQHIGAYSVKVDSRTITFLDTPGHEAFTTLRARGAQVTDIAILVVAADDGVMPQTVEAINHARAAETEIIVAINKIDKPQADVERVKRELSQYGLMDSDWGGQTTIVPVSAKTGENMDELLEMILLTADVLDLRANPDRQAKGTVIEARLDPTRGPVATILIQRGTLRQGDTVVVGSTVGRIRIMYNDRGQQIEAAGPSTPAEIVGLGGVPEGGDILYQVENERVARDLVDRRREEDRETALRQTSRMSLETLFDRMGEEDLIDLNIIVKADTQGSVEAMTSSMENLSTDKIRVNVIHGAVGAITESDIRLAEVADAIILGFNVRPAATAAQIAAASNVDIHTYRVIYEAIEEVESAMRGLLGPVFREVVTGHLEVREVFHASNVGTIAGCLVTDGRVHRNDSARLLRDGVVIYETKLASLRRFKDDVREVAAGYECGLSLERFNDIKVGDTIEVFTMKEEEADV